METRTLVALAATLLCAAKAHATTAVETARAHERDLAAVTAIDDGQGMPESPLGIAGPLAMSEPLQIQLGGTEPEPRADTSVFELSLDGLDVAQQ